MGRMVVQLRKVVTLTVCHTDAVQALGGVSVPHGGRGVGIEARVPLC